VNNLLRHFVVLKRNEKVHVNKAIEDTLDPLGTRVLWVDDYAEMPVQIEEIFRSVGEDWNAVFYSTDLLPPNTAF